MSPSESIRGLIAAVVGRGIHDPSIWARDYQIPRRLRDAIPSPMPRLVCERSVTSPVDGFQKLLFRTHDGLPVESVLIPLHKPGAVSVCLSSQVGCAMGCVFCATARMPRAETWKPGRSSTSSSRRASWFAPRAGGSPGRCSWGWESRS